jgi:hypothetical protein
MDDFGEISYLKENDMFTSPSVPLPDRPVMKDNLVHEYQSDFNTGMKMDNGIYDENESFIDKFNPTPMNASLPPFKATNSPSYPPFKLIKQEKDHFLLALPNIQEFLIFQQEFGYH